MALNRAATRSKRTPQDMKSAINKAMQGSKREAAGEIVGEVAKDGEFALTSPEAPKAASTAVGLSTVSAASCVRALEKAIGFGKSALYLEVSVAVGIFASSSTGADLATKREVMEIYRQAGFDTKPQSLGYKTASRRINASAALFNKLGREAVLQAMQGHRDSKAIESLVAHMGTYNFDGISAVLEFVGKAPAQASAAHERTARAARDTAELSATAVGVGARIAARQAERQALVASAQDEDGIIVSAGALSIVVPRDCKVADVRAMATRLMEFADRMEAEVGTPEEQRDREMHS